jgi:RNA recognition motif-containing protein
MASKIYVGGLPFSTTDAQLQEIFSAHGTVESVRIITDKFSGRSRGFGFVEMSSSEEAQRAIQALNGTDLEGRSITVNEARPQSALALVVIEVVKEGAVAVDVTVGELEL